MSNELWGAFSDDLEAHRQKMRAMKEAAWGAPKPAYKPWYVKWHIASRAVIDTSQLGWGASCSDSYIYYREPNEGDNVWYAYASRTQIGRCLQPHEVPAEVRLAVELMK